MCKMTKIDNMSTVKKTAEATDNAMGKSSKRPTPAFTGAKFDKQGYCLKHPSCQLVKPIKDSETGKLVYQELKVSCPSCQSIKHKAKKGTSLGGGKVRTGHRVHGAPSSSSRSRSKSREPSSRSSTGRSSSRARSKSRDAKSRNGGDRREYATPFDNKGRCHYHKNVQLAAKKQFGGGWKVLHSVCPKCMEDNFDAGDDDRSVRSGKSARSVNSACGGREDANGEYDKNGCCVLHTHIQVAKKGVFGRGFKVVRACPLCAGNDVDADDYSVKSGRSAKSTSSRRSTRSARSTTSRGKPGKAQKSGRYGALPFDADGFCCRHPSMQLAKKKALGGFKIIHTVCPECDHEGGGNGSSGRKKPQRRKSGTGRVFDDSGSETSSRASSRRSAGNVSKASGGSSARKKRIRVKNLKTEDEEGRHGRYSGYVNDDHQPHGNGVMKYADGSVYDGVWSEGSKVHGKTKKSGE